MNTCYVFLIALCFFTAGCSNWEPRRTPTWVQTGDGWENRITVGSSRYGIPASVGQPTVFNTGKETYKSSFGHSEWRREVRDWTYTSGYDVPGGVRVIESGKVTTPAVDVTADYPWWFDRWQGYREAPNQVQPSTITWP